MHRNEHTITPPGSLGCDAQVHVFAERAPPVRLTQVAKKKPAAAAAGQEQPEGLDKPSDEGVPAGAEQDGADTQQVGCSS